MFEWKVEEMKLTKELEKNEYYLFELVKTNSDSDKILFVDKMTDGKLSKILTACWLFDDEKWDLKKDYDGNVKTVSLKAWIKRNGFDNVVKLKDDCGNFYILDLHRNIKRWNVHNGVWERYDFLIDEIFYRALKHCVFKEKKYFINNDEYQVLKKKISDYSKKYGCFGLNIWVGDDISIAENRKVYANTRLLTLDELKLLVSKYEKIERFIEDVAKEVDIKY